MLYLKIIVRKVLKLLLVLLIITILGIKLYSLVGFYYIFLNKALLEHLKSKAGKLRVNEDLLAYKVFIKQGNINAVFDEYLILLEVTNRLFIKYLKDKKVTVSWIKTFYPDIEIKYLVMHIYNKLPFLNYISPLFPIYLKLTSFDIDFSSYLNHLYFSLLIILILYYFLTNQSNK